MSEVQETAPPEISEYSNSTKTLLVNEISSEKTSRKEMLARLAETLSIHEAASLVAMVHEKNSSISKGERFGLYPIQDWAAFERTKVLESKFWQADEVEFNADRNDFEELTPEEQKPLLRAFGFFAVGDGSIASMLAYRMILTAPTFEAQQFYVVQLDNERVHGETYGKMIYTLVSDPQQRKEIFDSVNNIPSIQRMNQMIEDGFTQPDGNRELYITLASAEYLMFTPLFCIIFWPRAYKRGKLLNVLFSNEQIAKDEALHCVNGCDNYRALPSSEKYTDEQVWEIVDRFVSAVSQFAEETLEDVNLTELTAENVKQYIRYVADDLLVRLDHRPKYSVSNPFKWMAFYTELVPKTNFYEGKVGEYSRLNVQESIRKAKDLCQNNVEKKPVQNVYQRAQSSKF